MSELRKENDQLKADIAAYEQERVELRELLDKILTTVQEDCTCSGKFMVQKITKNR